MANQVHGPEGMIFANKYRIVKLIGSGGMANVYLGIDMNTGANVAIKILKPEFSSDDEFIRRFDAEAKSVASLNHANIVKVYGVGHEGNFRYIVQEYIEGITVKDLINQNGHLDWKNAVPIVIQIGLALDYAHQNGIVHRDIKPQNILISRDRVAKITDFGIARAASSTTITMTGVQMGSVHYFSPEQARGGNVGPQSDIYSLGVSLFEMVTGRLPFDGDSNVAIAVKHLQETPPVPSSLMQGIPKGLDSIIAKCMQKSPERRYQTMRQLVTELDSLLVDPNGVYGVITNVPEKAASTDTNISFRQDPEYEKISEIEKSAESRRISRFRDNVLLALIIVVIVGVLIGIGILVIRAVGNATSIEQNTDYEIENYVGLKADEVIKKLDAANVYYSIEYQDSDAYEPGIVIAQSIREGVVVSTTNKISNLVLTVSSAEESVILQDYSNMNYKDAYKSLKNLGLEPVLRTEPSDNVTPGQVIRTEPEANTQVLRGESVIIIYATEPKSSIVPDVVGNTVAEAKKKLEESSLNYTIEGSPEVLALDAKKQYVILTNPVAGSSVARKSSVKLFVGTKEDYQNGGTPTPTPPQAVIDIAMKGSGTATGAGTYELNTQVTLTATPAAGFKFEYWMDSLGNIVTYSLNYTFVVKESTTFTVVFSALPTNTPLPTDTPTPVPPTPTPVQPDPGTGGGGGQQPDPNQNQNQNQNQNPNPGPGNNG
ncbi:serine/threonine-protein kinase [Ruminococcaceae bacterium R-25]|nr:serine/threonine-protein kinase [Ruminococcaceae bacterium R-25]SUQ11434.1 serine/threonine protein kinase [Oscillospiraceae bacterium]